MNVSGGAAGARGGGSWSGAQAGIGAGRSFGGGTWSGGQAGMGPRTFSGGNVRGAQASIGAGQTAGVQGGTFAGRGQFAQGTFRDGNFRGDRFHNRRFGPGVGFAAGLGVGTALGYGYGGYYDPYYYDDYAYDGYPVESGYAVSDAGDPSYCAQRYRSYDPASGTFLGYDGLRHPCP
jgi:hypothetical protein